LVNNQYNYFYLLEGASFFVIPAYFGIFSLGIFVYNNKSNLLLNIALSIPMLVILVPFIQLFPIGLGLKMLTGSALFVVFVYSLLIPVLGTFSNKKVWGWLFFVLAFAFLIKAHFTSGFEKGKAKPNSLLYIVDANSQKYYWATYDKVLDPWTKKYLGESPKSGDNLNKNTVSSKYNSGFSYATEAPKKNISEPTFTFLRVTIIGNYRSVTLQIIPNRNVNRMDVFADEKLKFHNMKANGIIAINQKGSFYKRKDSRLLNYYPIDNKPLTLSFQISKEADLEMEVMISSFDLLENPMFSIPNRPDEFIPMPFVLNDAIVVKKKIFKVKPIEKQILKSESYEVIKDSIIIKKDSLEAN